MADNATLITETLDKIAALDGTQTQRYLSLLKGTAVKLNIDTSAIQARLDALSIAGATIEQFAENAGANNLTATLTTGAIVEHLGDSIGSASLIEADGSILNVIAHPKLAAIVPESYGFISDPVILAGHAGQAAFSANGLRFISSRSESNNYVTVKLTYDGVETSYSTNAATYPATQSCISHDGTRGFAPLVYSTDTLGVSYISNGILQLRGLDSGYAESAYFAGAISGDGLNAYLLCDSDDGNKLKVYKSYNGFVSAMSVSLSFTYSTSNIYGVCTDYDGSHVYGFGNNLFYKSTDYGVTFTQYYNTLPFSPSSGRALTCSNNGQHILVHDRNYISRDYGVTFVPISIPSVVGFTRSCAITAYSLRVTDERLFVLCAGTDITTGLSVRFLGFSDDFGLTFTFGRVFLISTYLASNIGFPFFMSPDDSFMISTYYASGTPYKTETLKDKFLPYIPSKKIVGG